MNILKPMVGVSLICLSTLASASGTVQTPYLNPYYNSGSGNTPGDFRVASNLDTAVSVLICNSKKRTVCSIGDLEAGESQKCYLSSDEKNGGNGDYTAYLFADTGNDSSCSSASSSKLLIDKVTFPVRGNVFSATVTDDTRGLTRSNGREFYRSPKSSYSFLNTEDSPVYYDDSNYVVYQAMIYNDLSSSIYTNKYYSFAITRSDTFDADSNESPYCKTINRTQGQVIEPTSDRTVNFSSSKNPYTVRIYQGQAETTNNVCTSANLVASFDNYIPPVNTLELNLASSSQLDEYCEDGATNSVCNLTSAQVTKKRLINKEVKAKSQQKNVAKSRAKDNLTPGR